jgi:DNA-binding CsgD family transcriptional regulator
MGQLTQSDLEGVLAFLRTCEEYPDVASLRSGVLEQIRPLIRFDSAAYMEVDVPAHEIAWTVEPAGVGAVLARDAYLRWEHQHPNVTWHRTHARCGAVKLSDFVNAKRLRRLGLYREFLKPLGAEHQLTIAFRTSDQKSVGIPLNREHHDFAQRDRELLALLRPHMVQLARRAQERTRARALESAALHAGRAVILLENGDEPVPATGAARELLARWFAVDGRLPEPIADWLTAQRRRLNGNGRVPAPARPLVLERAYGRLVVEHLPGEPDVLLLEEQRAGLAPERLRALGLTARESEVLCCAERGLTDMQIAIELAISPRTVQKHLGTVYTKLAVPNRTAAVARARG